MRVRPALFRILGTHDAAADNRRASWIKSLIAVRRKLRGKNSEAPIWTSTTHPSAIAQTLARLDICPVCGRCGNSRWLLFVDDGTSVIWLTDSKWPERRLR